MIEAKWLVSEDLAAMLELLRAVRSGQQIVKAPHTVSDRKLRLFACACCRLVWHLLTDERSRRAVEVAERYADGLATEEELYAASQEAIYAVRGEENTPLFAPSWVADRERFLLAADRARSQNGSQFDKKAGATQAALLRDIVGNPFRPVTLPYGCKKCKGTGLRCNPATVNPIAKMVYCCPKEKGGCPWLTPTVLALARAAYGGPRGVACRRCGGEKVVEYEGRCKRCGGSGRINIAGVGDACPECFYDGKYQKKKKEWCSDCSGTGEALGPFNPTLLPILADALEDAGCTDPTILEHCHGPGPHARGCWALDLLLGKE